MSVIFQTLCTCVVCYLSMNMGIIFAWPSSTLKIFVSTNTTLHRPMSSTEVALFGSLSSIGAMVSTPLAGYLLDVVGRKHCALYSSLTFVVAWGMIASSQQVEVIFVAVFIAGLGASALLVVRVYVSEICQENVRGAMTTGSMVFYSFGLLLSYLLGDSLSYKSMVYVCLSISVVGVMLLSALRESPTYLMKKGLEDEAAKSVAFYRRTHLESKVVLEEMNTLKRAFNVCLKEVYNGPEEEKLQPVVEEDVTKVSFWKFMRNSQSSRRAAFLTLMLITAGSFQGLFVVQVYAKPLFEEAVPSLSPTLCSVIQAVIALIAGIISGYLSDMAGRRPLMIYSSAAAGLCCLALGSQLQYHWAPHWVTAVFLYTYTVAYSFGAGTVPYVLFTDVFLPQIKSVMSMVVIQWSWLCGFITVFIFNPLLATIGLGPVFYLFASVCFLGSIYSFFCLPETKGMPVDAVQLVLYSGK